MLWFECTINSPQQFWRASLTNSLCPLAAFLQQRLPKTGVCPHLCRYCLTGRIPVSTVLEPPSEVHGLDTRCFWKASDVSISGNPKTTVSETLREALKIEDKGSKESSYPRASTIWTLKEGKEIKNWEEGCRRASGCSWVVLLEGAGAVKTHRDYFLCVPLVLFQQEPSESGPVSLFFRWCDWGSDLSDFFEVTQEQSWDSNTGFPATCCLPPPPNFPPLFPTLRFLSDPDLNPHKSQAVWHPAKPHKHPTCIVLMLWGAKEELWNSSSLLIKKRFRPTPGSQFYLTATAFNRCCIFIVANVTHRSIFLVMLLGFCSICWRENICRNLSASLQGLKLQL